MVKAMATSSLVSLDLPDSGATRALAGRIALKARPGDIIALRGALGTGKTMFARAFIEAFARHAGAPPPAEIPSPTYTLVQFYDLGENTIYHFDLYRVESPLEAFELGIEDAFADGISLIEWPDRLGRLLPDGHLDIELSDGPNENARLAHITGDGAWPGRVAEIFRNG